LGCCTKKEEEEEEEEEEEMFRSAIIAVFLTHINFSL